MIEQRVTIVNKLGLHARAAAKLVGMASRFESHVELLYRKKRVNGKSIMGVMMLAAAKGANIDLAINGSDEQLALQQLCQLISEGFGEE